MTDPLSLDQTTPLVDHAPGALLQTDCELVGVLVTHDWRRLVAIAPIAAGQRLFVLQGHETTVPTRYSIQIARDAHLDQDGTRDMGQVVRHLYWRYMDHDCDPTTLIRGRSVVARRDIEPGEGITFNYNTTEADMAEPFRCHCKSALCVGVVRGANHLTPAQRELIDEMIADYLR
jgi:hypothetical protein